MLHFSEIRAAARMLMRVPGYAFTIVVVLALAIGGNAAVFTVLNTVVLRPLPFDQPKQLTTIWSAARGGQELGLTEPELIDFRNRNRTLSGLAGYATGELNLEGGSEPERVTATWATENLMRVLGVKPAHGRPFTRDDDLPDGPRVALLSHALWRDRFGADPDVVGRSIRLNGNPTTVIGIMPAGYEFPANARLWLPLRIDSANATATDRYISALARVRPGTSKEAVIRDLDRVVRELEREYPSRFSGAINLVGGVNAVPLQDILLAGRRQAILTLWLAVTLVLLIACSNVASLIVARSDARRREVAIRLALGGGQAAIMRQLLAEAIVLVASAVAGGLLVALWGVRFLNDLAGSSLLSGSAASVDVTVVLYTVAVALLTIVAFTIVPALQVRGVRLLEALRAGARGVHGGSARLRSALTIGQVGLTVALLIGAVLLVRSFYYTVRTESGFDPRNVTTLRLNLATAEYPEAAVTQRYYTDVIERVGAIRGVSSVGAVHVLPLSGANSDASLEIEGVIIPPGGQYPNAQYRVISGDYFSALGMTLLQGRRFEDDDVRTAGTVIVSRLMADRFWPGANVLGKRIRLRDDQPWLTVVGVVADVRHAGLTTLPRPTMYFPHVTLPMGAGWISRGMTVVVRTSGSQAQLIPEIRRAVRAIDPRIPISSVQSMEQVVLQSSASIRLLAVLFSLFALVGLLLAGVGIYGVIAYLVTRRTAELGLRIALGAQPSELAWKVIREGAAMAMAGTAIGTVIALLGAKALAGLVYGVRLADPLSFALAAALVLVAAASASLLPARRALHIRPMSVLRSE